MGNTYKRKIEMSGDRKTLIKEKEDGVREGQEKARGVGEREKFMEEKEGKLEEGNKKSLIEKHGYS
jgi:hypothetical protein